MPDSNNDDNVSDEDTLNVYEPATVLVPDLGALAAQAMADSETTGESEAARAPHAPPPLPPSATSARPTPAPNEPRPSVPQVESLAMIERLRSEAEASDDPTRKAVLLHEAAELEERAAGDELGAAREYLAAFNLDAGFREPLEALIRILERRRSLKNLGRVLESLAKAAELPDERARALRARAYDAIDVHGDRVGAREFIEQATEADPEDATSWLLLEIDAGLRGDTETRKRALARRVDLTSDPRWGALLRVDLAELRAAEGDLDDALDVLTEVVSSPGEAAFRACEVAERLSRNADRGDREAWALVQRGEIVLESLQDPQGQRGQGVPAELRRAGVAADAFVRAAAAYRSVGRVDDEVSSLERALSIDPSATMPHLARIAAASRLGDVDRAAVLARELLERGNRPALDPQLWLTIAEAALANGDRDGVLLACGKLLELAGDPAEVGERALVAKTLLTDLLLDGSDPTRLANLVESEAASRPTDEGKSRGFIEAAVVWALFVGDGVGARAALSQAVMHGADPRNVARIARALAACTPSTDANGNIFQNDAAWYDEASRRLRATAADAAEASDVDLDLARARLQRGDREAARQALEAVATGAPHALLARVLRLAISGDAAGDALIAELSAGSEGDAAVGFAVARAIRATRRQEESARTDAIDALAAASEGDDVASLVRAATLLRESPVEAANVLRELSRSSAEPSARDVLRIASAFLLARSGKVDFSVELTSELETDASHAIAPARAIWSRHLARNTDSERRTAMEATARDVMIGGGWSALERAADRLVSTGAEVEGPGAEELLGQLAQSDDPSLVRAALILQTAWPDDAVSNATKDEALAALERLGGDASRLVSRAALRKAQREADAPMAIAAAENWQRAGGGVPAAIEMLVAAELAADSEAEVRGRSALAASLTGPASQLVAASASIAAHVAGLPAPPLPASRDPESSAAVALAAFELAPPGCDPRRRENALRDVAEVLEDSSATLHELAAWSSLARGDHAGARTLFAHSLELAKARGDEPRSAIEGAVETELLAASGKPTAAWADLVERLADVVDRGGDPSTAAALFEQVGHALWDQLGDQPRGERALTEAFKRDNKRKSAFERVFRAIRGRKEDDALLEIVAHRLEATDDPPEMAKLFWEQARVLRAKGDRDGALNSLENVTMLEPDHVGALALSAEIYVGRQMYEEAAKALDRLSRQPVPVQQKVGAGLGAADLYETKLDRHDAALEVLVALDKAGLSDVAIHERIARAAARSEAWIPATVYFEKLIAERADASGRIEAAKIASAIYRDRMDDAVAAVPALLAWLREAPDDADALEQLLDVHPSPPSARETLVRSLQVTRALLQQSPGDARLSRIVARAAAVLGENDLRQIALGVLVALDAAGDGEVRALSQLNARLGAAPAVALDAEGMRRLAAPEEAGPILDLFRLMGPTIAEALGPTIETLSVGRKERIDPRSGTPLRNEVASWAGALGLPEFELYVGGRDPRGIQGVPGETPAIVLGSGVASPLSLEDRARLVREIVAVVRGTTIVNLRDDVAVAAIIVASCALVDVRLQAPPYSVLAETQKLLGKAIARKTKKVLPDIANAVARQLAGGDPRVFRGYALRTLDRASVLAAGDPGAALLQIVGSPPSGARVNADPRAQAMLHFVWSDDYLGLRRQLGLGIG